MCNAYKVEASLAQIGEAARSQLGLELAFAPGVTAETSNLVVPKTVFPRRDGLILRPPMRSAGVMVGCCSSPAVGPLRDRRRPIENDTRVMIPAAAEDDVAPFLERERPHHAEAPSAP